MQALKFISYWDLLTFKFVNAMMDRGAMQQLGFEDLVQLPCELIPPCRNILLDSWLAEQDKHYSQPSLFRAIFNAYGWSYLRLGLLKV